VKNPAAKYNKHDLKQCPVIVITHRSFQPSPWLRLWNPGESQEPIPRQLKIIDERIDEYHAVDIDLGDATKLRDFIVTQATEVDQDDATAVVRQARAVAAMRLQKVLSLGSFIPTRCVFAVETTGVRCDQVSAAGVNVKGDLDRGWRPAVHPRSVATEMVRRGAWLLGSGRRQQHLCRGHCDRVGN
jgi:hypothetical protein